MVQGYTKKGNASVSLGYPLTTCEFAGYPFLCIGRNSSCRNSVPSPCRSSYIGGYPYEQWRSSESEELSYQGLKDLVGKLEDLC